MASLVNKNKINKFLCLLLNVSLLIYSVSSSLIYENRPKYLLLDEFKNEIFNVQKLNSISKLDFGVFHHEDNTTKVDISNVTQQLNYLEVNKLVLKLDSDDFLLSGLNGTMSLNYNFIYNTSGGVSGMGSFFIKSIDFLISKSYSITNDTRLQSNAELIKLSFEASNLLYHGKEVESYLSKLLLDAINSMIEVNLSYMKSAYNSDIYSYYSTVISNKTDISFKSKDPSLDFTLDYSSDRLPLKVNENNVIYYHSGKLNNNSDKHIEPVELSKDVYQVVINKQVFVNFFSELSKDDIMDFTFNQKNKADNIPYNLLIQSFGVIIPEIYDLYSKNDKLEVWSKIVEIKMNDDQNPLNGKFTLYTEVYHSRTMRKLITFNSSFAFKLKFSVNSDSKLNFYLDNTSVDIVNINTVSPTTYSRINLGILKKWVDNTIKSYFYSNNYFLIDNSIDLSPYFKTISSVDVDQNGFRITGSPMMNENKSLNELGKQIIKKNFENNFGNNLKFLN